jgi:pimeloyl-ACP methyl ester carboxylesterase
MKRFFAKAARLALRTFLNVQARFAPLAAGKLALDFFRTPRRGRLRASDEEFLSKAQHEVLMCGEIPIQAYHWEGTGPSVLLAHGWESNTVRWTSVIHRFRKKHFRIIALDAPAHGASGSDRFDAVLYAKAIRVVSEKYQPDFILGHSVGGMAAVYYLAEHRADWVKGLLIMASPVTLRIVFQGFQRIMGVSDRVMEALERRFEEKYQNATVDSFDLKLMAHKVNQLTALMYADNDPIAPATEGRKLAATWTGAQFHEFQGAGHSLKGQEVLKTLDRILEGWMD